MSQVQIEATIDAILNKLTANLNAKIDEINEGITDEWKLEHPKMLVTGARAERTYPAILVLPDSTENTVDTGGTIIWNHRVMVSCWLSNWVEEGLARQLMRMQRAVRETILKDRKPGEEAGGYGLQHVRDEYGPVFRPEPNGWFVQSVESLFRVQQQQYI